MDGLILCFGFLFVVRVAVEQHVGVFLSETLLLLGWVVGMCGFVYDFPMCWHWACGLGCLHACSFLSCIHALVGLTCLGLRLGELNLCCLMLLLLLSMPS